MSYFDVLFAVILRIPSENGIDIHKNVKNYSASVGNALIDQGYTDFGVYPLGMELVEDDMKVRILNHLEMNDEFPEGGGL